VVSLRLCDRAIPVFGFNHAETLFLQPGSEQESGVVKVIDDQNRAPAVAGIFQLGDHGVSLPFSLTHANAMRRPAKDAMKNPTLQNRER
jgi:hypothetical protein